jgi:hypothetical protein
LPELPPEPLLDAHHSTTNTTPINAKLATLLPKLKTRELLLVPTTPEKPLNAKPDGS